MSPASDLCRLLPVTVDDRWRVTLASAGPAPFDEPFLAETLAKAPTEGCIGLDQLRSLQPDGLPAPAIIVHTGRSGSTLLCRLLDDLSEFVTYREPEALAATLSADRRHGTSIAQVVARQFAWHAPGETVAVVKLPSISATDLLGSALAQSSDTPLVVLTRPTEEIVPRLMSRLPWWLIDRLGRAGEVHVEVRPDGGASAPEELTPAITEVVDRMLADLESVASTWSGPILRLGYDDLIRAPEASLRMVTGHLGRDPSIVEQRSTWRERLDVHAKSGAPFERRPEP